METCKSAKLKLVRKDPTARAKSFTHGVLAPLDSGSDLLQRVASSCSSAADSSNPPSPPTPNPKSKSIVKAKSVDCGTVPLKLAETPEPSVNEEGSPQGVVSQAEPAVDEIVGGRDFVEGKAGAKELKTTNVTRKDSRMRGGGGAGIALGALLIVGCVVASLYMTATLKVVQDLAREMGVLEQMVAMTKRSNRFGRLTSQHLIQRLTKNNHENKERVVQQGMLPVLVSTVGSKNAADDDQISASLTIAALAKGSSRSRDAILANGAIPALLDAAKGAENPKVKSELVNTLAIILATRDDVFRNSVMAAQGVDLFVEMLDSGATDASHSVSAAWALANLAHMNTVAQNSIGRAGGVEPLVRLLWSGWEQLESQTALLAVGNLVIRNSLNQDAVRDAGGVEATVKLLEASVDGFSTKKAPAQLDVKFVQEILEAYKANHVIRRAIREIGGVQTFIRLALPEDFEALEHAYPFQNALVLVSREMPDGNSMSGFSNVLTGWEETSIEMGAAEEKSAGDVVENSENKASDLQGVQAVLMEEVGVVGGRVVAERASWALRNLAANNMANKDAVRKVGGVELLVQILTSSRPAVTKSAASTLATLASQNIENQIVVRKAHGVETLVRLIGTHPDKEVVDAAAKLLRILALGEISKQDGRVQDIGKWVAEWIQSATRLVLGSGEIAMLGCAGMFMLGVVIRLVVWKL
ncbi:hypothetical protein BSKO_03279 [Bryopsis sp. KO-2023]|nr:hypothetical protein BSKO_03279 [Bryopsis sp. KO-2023]